MILYDSSHNVVHAAVLGWTPCSKVLYLHTGDCRIFATWKRIANHRRAVTFTNQNPWNGLHIAKIPQSPVMSPIPRVLIGGRDPPLSLCFTCCKYSAISCTYRYTSYKHNLCLNNIISCVHTCINSITLHHVAQCSVLMRCIGGQSSYWV